MMTMIETRSPQDRTAPLEGAGMAARRGDAGENDIGARRDSDTQVKSDLQVPRRPVRHFLGKITKSLATLIALAVLLLASLVIWQYYVTSPWTRDGRIRVQVASIAPQVSGQITTLRVRDNQFVRKGDVLYVIDPFDFTRTLASAKATLRAKAADLQVKQVQAERRMHLSDLATTSEEQQTYSGTATQARANFDAAEQDLDQAAINLDRTAVRSPVSGYVTNLLMRVGDYAHAGTTDISIVDADSYWVDGYFEETKMAHVCVGDPAEVQLMGYGEPILGQVESVTRGISVADASPSTQGLPNVDPIYTWVRLAQRVPVRIKITRVPPDVPLVSGMTATVTIRHGDEPAKGFDLRWEALRNRFKDVLAPPKPRAGCVPPSGPSQGAPETLPDPRVPAAQTPDQINPALSFGMIRARP